MQSAQIDINIMYTHLIGSTAKIEELKVDVTEIVHTVVNVSPDSRTRRKIRVRTTKVTSNTFSTLGFMVVINVDKALVDDDRRIAMQLMMVTALKEAYAEIRSNVILSFDESQTIERTARHTGERNTDSFKAVALSVVVEAINKRRKRECIADAHDRGQHAAGNKSLAGMPVSLHK